MKFLSNLFWIPTRIKLPKNCDVYLVTILDSKKDKCFVDFAYFYPIINEWWCSKDTELYKVDNKQVIAWKKYPKPFVYYKR